MLTATGLFDDCAGKRRQPLPPEMFIEEAAELRPFVEVTEINDPDQDITVYRPRHMLLAFTNKRPQRENDKIYLCVAAAFTGKDYIKVCGTHVVDGTLTEGYAAHMNGFAFIDAKQVIIRPSSDSIDAYLQRAVDEGASFFQQILLVSDGKIVEDHPLPAHAYTELRYRRALALKRHKPMIIESNDEITISKFAQMLVHYGVSDALYLDMGNWSEGWMRNKSGETLTLGTPNSETEHQTNWLIFKENDQVSMPKRN